ncbi:MAG: carboxypeptidase regulatory-like domain-containing protein, partial [Elusimicrobiales bacterium]|nr:carboxypeptidase regulatory-like domain-containing protein [Elusimicrobiales bacterium]
AGAVYSTSTLLAPCSFYTYSIEAKDVYNTAATPRTGTGPDVRIYMAGQVTDSNGNPMGSVTLNMTGDATRSYLTAADGLFMFTNVSPGSYTITPSSAAYFGFTPASSTIIASGNITGLVYQRLNSAPALAWTGDTDYINKGVYPSTGATETDTFVFKVLYTDLDDEDFQSLKLYLKKDGIVVNTIPVVNCGGSNVTGKTCSYGTTISTSGVYAYQFVVVGRWGENVSSPQLAFLVNVPPTTPAPDLSVIADKQTVVSSEVTLKWTAQDPEGGPITYDLYFSVNSGLIPAARAMRPAAVPSSLVYTGSATSYTVQNLIPGKTYYWKVDATNQYGVTAQGNIMTFTTLDTVDNKVFNYPNPFNPNTQKTKIVFKVPSPETVKIKIYSEYGDLLTSFNYSALSGTNEAVWDGRDKSGRVMFDGSYIARVEKTTGAAKC